MKKNAALRLAVGFPVFSRCTASDLAEGLGEVADVLKSAPTADVGDLVHGGQEHLGSFLNAVLLDILNGSGADGCPETAQTLTFADGGAVGNQAGSQLVGIVFMDVLQHNFDPLAVPDGFAGG